MTLTGLRPYMGFLFTTVALKFGKDLFDVIFAIMERIFNLIGFDTIYCESHV